MKLKHIGLAMPLVAVLGLSTSVASATGEVWPMFFNCHTEVESSAYPSTSDYGYHNDDASDWMDLVCEQTHVIGNNGFDDADAYVYDRHTSLAVSVELCRSNGSGSWACQTRTSSGNSCNVINLDFDSAADSYSFYYWKVSVPPLSTGCSGSNDPSHLNSLNFDDN